MERRCPVSSIDNLKKEAKRWLRAIRAGDADAYARFARAFGDASVTGAPGGASSATSAAPNRTTPPTLRDVQHALARERGFDNWSALRAALEQLPHGAELLAALLDAATRGDAQAVAR